MKIRRIQVPHFRVLQDVDLSFDGSYTPQAFPLGSENGGGKSTLLQLIFALLHCSRSNERLCYLRNLMSSFRQPQDEAKSLVARICIEISGSEEIFEFWSLNASFITVEPIGTTTVESVEGFGVFSAVRKAEGRASQKKIELDQADKLRKEIARELETYLREGRVNSPRGDRGDIPLALMRKLASIDPEVAANFSYRGRRSEFSLAEAETALESLKVRVLNEADRGSAELKELNSKREQLSHLLRANNLLLLADYASKDDQGNEHVNALVCNVEGVAVADARTLLRLVAPAVFLLGPSSQQYLFLDPNAREQHVGDGQGQYMQHLSAATEKLPGLYAYDWLSVRSMIQLFTRARDKDFAKAIDDGVYGDNYTKMLREINGLLPDKKVRPLRDLSGIKFMISDGDDNDVEIGLEDLSRGELKRLMVYAWLKANGDSENVVMIDEIEVSLHPDWQAEIINDLIEWAPKNQYILATHSYELCRAVTPGHVRELFPKLSGLAIQEGE